MPHDYVFDPDDNDYDQLIIVMASTMVEAITKPLKSAQTTFAHGTEPEAAPFTVSCGLLPADGYMNPSSSTIDQQRQWKAHPLTLKGTLNEGDVRKGETTMCKFLVLSRWHNEYGKAFNAKQFTLNLSTTHGEDLSKYASYAAYITGSNKIFYSP